MDSSTDLQSFFLRACTYHHPVILEPFYDSLCACFCMCVTHAHTEHVPSSQGIAGVCGPFQLFSWMRRFKP